MGPRGAEIYKPKVGPGGDSGPIIVNTPSILGELPAAVTSPTWPPRGPHLVGVFHWGVSTGVASVGVPLGAVAWQPNTARPAAIFDCAGAVVGGRGRGGRVNTPLKCGRGDVRRLGGTRPAQAVGCAGARLAGRGLRGRVNTPTKCGRAPRSGCLATRYGPPRRHL